MQPLAYRDTHESCPRCGVDLVDARSARACTSCRGLWVAEPIVAEMVLAMLPPRPFAPLVLAVLEPRGETLGCPTCKQAMHATTMHGVPLDRCAKHGVWFDAGELEEALHRVADPSRRPAVVAGAAPSQRGALRFAIEEPDGSTRVVRVTPPIIKIGKVPNAHVYVDDPSAGRMHAVIDASAASVDLIDLGTQAGTFVNGTRITKAPLLSGDRIRIGSTTITVTFEP